MQIAKLLSIMVLVVGTGPGHATPADDAVLAFATALVRPWFDAWVAIAQTDRMPQIRAELAERGAAIVDEAAVRAALPQPNLDTCLAPHMPALSHGLSTAFTPAQLRILTEDLEGPSEWASDPQVRAVLSGPHGVAAYNAARELAMDAARACVETQSARDLTARDWLDLVAAPDAIQFSNLVAKTQAIAAWQAQADD